MTTDDTWDDPSYATESDSTPDRISPGGFALFGVLANLGAAIAFLTTGTEGVLVALGLLTASCAAGALGEGLARCGDRPG